MLPQHEERTDYWNDGIHREPQHGPLDIRLLHDPERGRLRKTRCPDSRVGSEGAVKLPNSARFSPLGAGPRGSSASACHPGPDAGGARSQQPVMNSAKWMSAHSKEVLIGSVHRKEPLRVRNGLEPAHLAFPLPGRLVGDFRAVVRVLFLCSEPRTALRCGRPPSNCAVYR
jgi:hypothetical protein